MLTKKTAKMILFISFACLFLSCSRMMPKGTSVETKSYKMKEPEFLYDLTYEKDGKVVTEQKIWNKIFSMIDEAQDFLILDVFLYNDEYSKKVSYPKLSKNLTDHLIAKKKSNPGIDIILITDEVNEFYGAYKAHFLEDLKKNGVKVIVTNLNKLPDSNFVYSKIWRTSFRWFGTSGKGWLKNPFNAEGPKVNMRSYLKLLNFKANHRKVVINENGALVTSSNPHDPSANHSNIGFYMNGSIVNPLIKSELAVAKFSDKKFKEDSAQFKVKTQSEGNVSVKLVTEGKIKKNILEVINNLEGKDKLNIGVFYLSDRKVVKALVKAANRGVNIRLILDANKDAFGMKKNGVPNRPVAAELNKKTHGKIKIKWYLTHGEQFHTKLLYAKMPKKSIIIGGSANFTRRNISDYNLETDIMIEAKNNTKIVETLDDYYDRIWFNRGGEYTVGLEKYYEDSLFKKTLYRFQEWSGLSTY